MEIISHRVVLIPQAEDAPAQVRRITYRAEGLPPRTIWIDVDRDSEENVKLLIKADLQSVLGREVDVELQGGLPWLSQSQGGA